VERRRTPDSWKNALAKGKYATSVVTKGKTEEVDAGDAREAEEGGRRRRLG
jgi:hypothetical protein